MWSVTCRGRRCGVIKGTEKEIAVSNSAGAGVAGLNEKVVAAVLASIARVKPEVVALGALYGRPFESVEKTPDIPAAAKMSLWISARSRSAAARTGSEDSDSVERAQCIAPSPIGSERPRTLKHDLRGPTHGAGLRGRAGWATGAESIVCDSKSHVPIGNPLTSMMAATHTANNTAVTFPGGGLLSSPRDGWCAVRPVSSSTRGAAPDTAVPTRFKRSRKTRYRAIAALLPGTGEQVACFVDPLTGVMPRHSIVEKLLGSAKAFGHRTAGALDVGSSPVVMALEKNDSSPHVDRTLVVTSEIVIEPARRSCSIRASRSASSGGSEARTGLDGESDMCGVGKRVRLSGKTLHGSTNYGRFPVGGLLRLILWLVCGPQAIVVTSL